MYKHSLRRLYLYFALISCLLLLYACGGGNSGAVSGIFNFDNTPPAVVSFTPSDKATDVSHAVSITVTFSENIDESTLSADSFRVSTDGVPVSGAITYSNKTATFKPALAFRRDTTYNVELTTAIKDEAGNPLENSMTWSFMTGMLFDGYTAITTGSYPEAVAIGDVNGDGRNDVVMTTSYLNDSANDYKIFVFLQNSAGGLEAPVKYATSCSYTSMPKTIDIGDINNDGKNDIVIGCSKSGIEVFAQNASGNLNTGLFYASSDSSKIKIADLNNDGKTDIVGIGWGTNSASVWLQNGGGTLNTPVSYTVTHGGYDDLEVGDINNDGLTDIIVMSGQSLVPNLGILTQNAGGTFNTAVYYYISNPVTANTLTRGVGVGDINGDHLQDVVVTYGSNNIGIFLQNASNTLSPVNSFSSLGTPEPIVVEDVTGDGLNDIIVLHGSMNKAGVYEQKADGTLYNERLYTIPYATHYNPHGLAVGDINGDGQKDIVIADYNNGLVILYNHYSAP